MREGQTSTAPDGLLQTEVRHRIRITDTGDHFDCPESETALVALAKTGKRGIPVGCRGGGCGVCKVQVIEGQYQSRVMSRTHVSALDEAKGRVLACCIYPRADLQLQVIGAMRKAVCAPRAEPHFEAAQIPSGYEGARESVLDASA